MKRIGDIYRVLWEAAQTQLDADHQAIRDKINDLEWLRDRVETHYIGFQQADMMRYKYDYAIAMLKELLSSGDKERSWINGRDRALPKIQG